MQKLVRFLSSELGRLVSLAISLVALMWLLSFIGSRGWGPFSGAANWTRNNINGGSAPVVAAPTISPVATTTTYHVSGM